MKTSSKRTQLYLPAELHEQAVRYAKARGLSLAAVVRIALHESLDRTGRVSKRGYEHDAIWKLVGAGQSQDGDLSARHDQYLYGRSTATSS